MADLAAELDSESLDELSQIASDVVPIGDLHALVKGWAEESHGLAGSVVYSGAVGAAIGGGGATAVGTQSADWDAYAAEASAVVRRRLQLGGARLAQVLNSVVSGRGERHHHHDGDDGGDDSEDGNEADADADAGEAAAVSHRAAAAAHQERRRRDAVGSDGWGFVDAPATPAAAGSAPAAQREDGGGEEAAGAQEQQRGGAEDADAITAANEGAAVAAGGVGSRWLSLLSVRGLLAALRAARSSSTAAASSSSVTTPAVVDGGGAAAHQQARKSLWAVKAE